ncbi:MAG TPA: YicC family protein [Clostridia bacterium]|nr:YicC family protein [Clostridia bacterium]HPB17010.1 YicC family protein [Clostridia bacterium]HQM97084.1 YicC family protein [Clostridia bacterium]
MAYSMTGYGKSLYENELISMRIEIKSVNSKFLDLSLRLPKNISFAEEKVRNLLRTRITRGKIDCYVTIYSLNADFMDIKFDEKAADAYYGFLKSIKKRYNLISGITPVQIASFQGVINVSESDEDYDKLTECILEAFNIAIDNILDAKKKEGEELCADCALKLAEFENHVKQVEILSEELPMQYKQKLEKRISELIEDLKADETRIAQEVAFFADRACVDEEIIRLKSHIKQFSANLGKESSGKKLDFILQEMLRETNTIASKANNLDVTNSTLEMKYLLEKIREQIQNLE